MSAPDFKTIIEEATQGEWSVPHFADDSCKCNCRYVLCEHYMGAICTVHVADNRPISDGGNDDPIESEAKANAQLIARCNPAVMRVVWEALERATWAGNGDDPNQFYCAGCSAHHQDSSLIVHGPTCCVANAIALLNGATPTDKKDE